MGQFNINDTIDKLTAIYEAMDDEAKKESEPLLYLFGHMIESSNEFNKFMNHINEEIDIGSPNVKKINNCFIKIIEILKEANKER